MARWRILLWVAIVLAILAFLYTVRSILLPFILGFIIAVLLEPLVRKLRLRGFSRGTAIGVIMVGFFGAMTALGIWATPRVSAQLGDVRNAVERLTADLAEESANENIYVRWNPVVKAEAPGLIGSLDRTFEQLAPTLQRFGLPTNRRALYDQFIEPHQGEISNAIQEFFNGFLVLIGGAASQVLLLLLTPLLVAYMLSDMDSFRIRSASWIPPSIRSSTLSILSDMGDVFKNYLRGVTLVIILYIIAMSVLLALMGTPYSILLAILAGALYMVPYLGAILSSLAIFVVTGLSGVTGPFYFQFDSAWTFAAIVTGVFFVMSNMVFDQFVYPRVVGKSVNLNPVVSMFVILSGGAIFGLPGMIIAFPLAGSIKVVLDRLIRLTNTPTAEVLQLPVSPLRHRQSPNQ